jgi:hypothetical protein
VATFNPQKQHIKHNGMRFYFEVLSLYCLSSETMYKTLRVTVATVATLTHSIETLTLVQSLHIKKT